jgi:hypothetical protein
LGALDGTMPQDLPRESSINGLERTLPESVDPPLFGNDPL